jgi:glyoxylase I family protein
MAERAMNPIHVTKLDHVVLRVADIKQSIHFYCDILGCPEKRISDWLHQYQAGSSMIDLVPIDSDIGRRSGYGPPEAGRNVDHFALTIGEFDEEAIVAYLEENGVTVDRSGRRFGAQGYGPSVYFQDPDGNFVELKGPSEEAP